MLYDEPCLPYSGQDDWTDVSGRRDCSTRDSETLRCLYAGRRCHNSRATKLNGTLHKMCHDHRIRANQNQHRSQLRRRRKQGAVKDNESVNLDVTSAVSVSDGIVFPIQPQVFPHDEVAADVHSLCSAFSSSMDASLGDMCSKPTPPENAVLGKRTPLQSPVPDECFLFDLSQPSGDSQPYLEEFPDPSIFLTPRPAEDRGDLEQSPSADHEWLVSLVDGEDDNSLMFSMDPVVQDDGEGRELLKTISLLDL